LEPSAARQRFSVDGFPNAPALVMIASGGSVSVMPIGTPGSTSPASQTPLAPSAARSARAMSPPVAMAPATRPTRGAASRAKRAGQVAREAARAHPDDGGVEAGAGLGDATKIILDVGVADDGICVAWKRFTADGFDVRAGDMQAAGAEPSRDVRGADHAGLAPDL